MTNNGDTHYRTLGLTQNCTSKEVRDAFVNLSKLHHPDRSKANNSDSHKTFVKINEAYSVLSKPGLRRDYDSTLVADRFGARSTPYNYQYKNNRSNPWQTYEEPDPIFSWRDETIERGKRARSNPRSNFYNANYYGVRGVKRQSNPWVASFTLMVMGFGIVLHYFAFKYSTGYSLARLDNQQEIYYRNLDKSREEARTHGNEAQLEKFETKVKDTDRNKPF